MTQPTLFFDGRTYVHERDGERLGKQYKAVLSVMRDGEWHTLAELARVADASEASVSARLRDMRKERFGKHQVERRYVRRGLWEYQLVLQ